MLGGSLVCEQDWHKLVKSSNAQTNPPLRKGKVGRPRRSRDWDGPRLGRPPKVKRPPVGIDETPSTRTAATTPAALLDDLELTAQRNLALARLNSSPLPPIQTNHMNNASNNSVANGPNNVGPNSVTEQSLYSHLYGKEMGLMRKLSNIDEYPNHAARNYQQLLQHSEGILPPGAAHTMQQNFSGHPHAAKFNQFNYPNPGGLLKPCYDYASQQQQAAAAAAAVAQQHHLQSHQNTASGTGSNATPTSNQQMKKEMFNLSGSNGADLYTSPPSTSSGSVASQASTAGANGATNTTASSMANGGSAGNGSLAFMNLHQSSSAAAAAVAAAMYANHFNTNGTGGSGGLSKMDNGDSLADFNPMRNVGGGNPLSNGPPNNNNGSNNLIKSADSVLMARSSIMNNLNNNLNKIEPNTDTTLNDNNNNPHNHHHQQQQGHNHLSSHQQQHHGGGHHPFHHQMNPLGGGNGGVATGPGNNDDDNDKLSSPLTGTSSLTNTDLNDPENEGNDDGYTIL